MTYLDSIQNPLRLLIPLSLLSGSLLAIPMKTLAESSIEANNLLNTGETFCEQVAEPHYIGGGDRIAVKFLEADQYSEQYLVPEGGLILMPLVGPVNVEGLTLEQLTSLITTKYLQFFQQKPLVSVTLMAPRPISIAVTGEVTRPGVYTVPQISGTGDTRPGIKNPRLTQALELAAGTTLTANVEWIQIRRQESGIGEKIITVNLWELLRSGNSCQDITLRDGDTIFVPATTESTPQEIRQLSMTTFAAKIDQPRSVLIVGEVVRPGSYVVQGGNTTIDVRLGGLPTVSRALQLAGGVVATADIRNIQIRRPTNLGLEQTINVNFWQLLVSGNFNDDPIIQDGDTIIVPRAETINTEEIELISKSNFSRTSIQVSVVGEVKVAGVLELPPSASLNQALLAAGGLDRVRAKQDIVQLIRVNPNGTVDNRSIEINWQDGINETTNPILYHNDVIVVNPSRISQFSDNVENMFRFIRIILPSLQIYRLLGF